MVHAYTLGTPDDKPDLDRAERNLSKLLKQYRNATGWRKESRPLMIYEIDYDTRNGYVTSFKGKVIGKYWCDWANEKVYYKTGSKLYSVSKEGRLTEIRRKSA